MSDSGHKRVLLKDISAPVNDSFVDGPFGSSLKSEEYVATGVRLIQLQNIGDGYWRDSNKKYITEQKFNSLVRHGAKPGDIAIAKMADPVARACIVPDGHEKYVVVADCIRLRVDEEKYDSHYIVRAINSRYTRLEAEAKSIGSTRVRINLGTLKSVGCLVPPLEEQRTVSIVLDTLDTTIRQTEAIIEKLKQIKQGLLHDLLTRGIDDNGELRPPQSEAPELYKESALGWIPREWTVELLDDVAIRGSGHTPSKSVSSYWNGGIKWVSLADSNRLDDIYINATDKEISDLGIANSSAVIHPAGTVVLSRDAGVGKSAILASDMAVSQHFMAWQCGNQLNSLYLYFRLQYMKPEFESIALGSTVKTIGLDYFRKLRILVPPQSEQDKISAGIMNIEIAVRKHQSELKKLRLLKSGLMNDLLTGRVRVTPLLESAAA